MTSSVRFAGVEFARPGEPPVEIVLRLSAGTELACVVTPNVDHALRLDAAPADSPYAATLRTATLSLCDSRVLRLIARAFGIRLDLCTGADLTAELLGRAAAQGLAVGLVGPSAEQADRLRRLHPGLPVYGIDTPADLALDAGSLDALADRIEATPWRVLLIALGAPKQEHVAAVLAARAARGGAMLCVGAAVDYLTGTQRRAPAWMQRLCLEWLFRLGTQPRLRGRYFGGMPRLVALVLRTEVLPRLRRAPAPATAAARRAQA